jgi:hypothetical protein
MQNGHITGFMGPLRRGLPWWSFLVKSKSLTRGEVMTMTLTDNLDDDSHLQWCV